MVSEDFAWHPGTPARRRHVGVRVAVVLACAGLGIAAGSYYPLRAVLTAFERANLPRVSDVDLSSKATQRAQGESLAPVPGVSPKPAPPVAGGQIVLLNPGSAEPPPARDEQSASMPSAGRGTIDQRVTLLQPLSRGDRNVLVVVRRRGPPYDTKVLRGRIQNGQLIVNARGITLR
jgi:hypothetical protein